MNMQNNLIAKAATVITAVVLVLAIFITTIDALYTQSPSDLFTAEQDAQSPSDLFTPKQDAFDSDIFCDPCPNNSNFYHIGVLRGSYGELRWP